MNSIVDFIKRYQSENPTGWRKWIIGSVVAVLVVVMVAVYAFQASMRGRELARLQTERDRAKEDQHRAEVDQKLAQSTEEAARHEAAAELAIERAHAIEEQIKHLESQHETNQATIDSIRSWDDVDKKVK